MPLVGPPDLLLGSPPWTLRFKATLTAALWATNYLHKFFAQDYNMADASIRKQLRSQRRSLSAEQQYILSEKITAILSVQPFFLRAKRVGIYLANDGEIDPSTIVDICLKSSKKCFLPVIHPLKINRLHFARYRQNSQLIANRFGIL